MLHWLKRNLARLLHPCRSKQQLKPHVPLPPLRELAKHLDRQRIVESLAKPSILLPTLRKLTDAKGHRLLVTATNASLKGNGITMPEKAHHQDTGKARLSLVPPEFIEFLAHVFEYGEKKYGTWNWIEHADDWKYSELMNSALRHIGAFNKTETIDPESKLPHLWHAAWNILALAFLMEHEKGTDDRRPSFFGNGASPTPVSNSKIHELTFEHITSRDAAHGLALPHDAEGVDLVVVNGHYFFAIEADTSAEKLQELLVGPYTANYVYAFNKVWLYLPDTERYTIVIHYFSSEEDSDATNDMP